MTDPARIVPTPRDSEDGRLAWDVHPARERPAAAAGTACASAAFAVVAGLAEHWLVGVLVLGVLVLALHRFWFPVRFVVDAAEGMSARALLSTQHLPWSRIRRFVHDERGGHASRRARPSRLDAFTGVHLLWPEDPRRREAIISAIDHARAARADKDPR